MRRALHQFSQPHDIFRSWVWIFLLNGLLLLTGCQTVQDYSLTCRLWNTAEMRHFAEPASDPHLELFIAPPKDLLVRYDEVREQDQRIRRRAYFLCENLDRIARRKKPRFVNPQLASSLVRLPVESRSRSGSPASTGAAFASYDSDTRQFSVEGMGRLNGVYELPAYVESNENVTRVALTPLAVAGDTAVVAAVAGVVAAYAYVASGAPCFSH